MVVDPGGGNVVTVESMAYVEDDIDRELAADRARKDAEANADGGARDAAGADAADEPAVETEEPERTG
jgi:hypothetical protein